MRRVSEGFASGRGSLGLVIADGWRRPVSVSVAEIQRAIDILVSRLLRLTPLAELARVSKLTIPCVRLWAGWI